MKTAVCYYPEHWPQERWATDAAHMKRIGLSHVRVGEFAWSRLEHADGSLHFHWLNEAIDTLHAHDLKVVLGTPTATPPRWMVDRYPDMLAMDDQLRVRDFGSRRHYCFSHTGYLRECQRMVTSLAEHFGEHPGIVAWQTDNEYGCHSTSISYSPHALIAFRQWCACHYDSIDALNTAWGNVFWSMEYNHFEQIGLPVGTVTESNPAHQLAFWRFSSDQIRRFNKAQVDIIRQHSPGRDVVHNFMGNFVEFDHHLVCEDLDVATWDNYPLGFLTRDNQSVADQERYLRTGHPDGSAFHHDLYRGCCAGRWWVMEQQPGPVNWAPYNPSPLPGMVRLWGWEAFAHGAEVMSYFRWRQAPFAQEQTHSALLLSNGDEDIAANEVAQLNRELQSLVLADKPQVESEVAILFSYVGVAMQDIQRPGGHNFSALRFCQNLHSACRQWGLNVDIVAPTATLDTYRLILVCNYTQDDADFSKRLAACQQLKTPPVIVLFPGSGSRSADYAIPSALPPGQLQSLIDVQVVRSESLPVGHKLVATAGENTDAGTGADIHIGVAAGTDAFANTDISEQTDAEQPYLCAQWREQIRSSIAPRLHFADGWGFHYVANRVHYINALPEQASLLDLLHTFAVEAGLSVIDLGPDLRTQHMGRYRIAVNYGVEPVDLLQALGASFGLAPETDLVVGSNPLKTAQVAVWMVSPHL